MRILEAAFRKNLFSFGWLRHVSIPTINGDTVFIRDFLADRWVLQVVFLFAISLMFFLSNFSPFLGQKNDSSESIVTKEIELPHSGCAVSLSHSTRGNDADRIRPDNTIKVATGPELVHLLKEYSLWDLSRGVEVPPILFAGYPEKLDHLETDVKKRTFLHTLLPVVLVALKEIEHERNALKEIVEKLGGDPSVIVFDRTGLSWQGGLSVEEVEFVRMLAGKYRTRRANELIDRVNVVPISLILAQGAVESSWGSSRFAREGNNLFGMWTWSGRGMVPARRDPGKTHRVAIYDSILEAVKHYLLTLNRLSAYEDLRRIRRQSMDPTDLLDGLLLYSERGSNYTDDIKRVIDHNNLKEYDKFQLAEDWRYDNTILAAKPTALSSGQDLVL